MFEKDNTSNLKHTCWNYIFEKHTQTQISYLVKCLLNFFFSTDLIKQQLALKMAIFELSKLWFPFQLHVKQVWLN